jgi:redox-sensitive bicupin YhaK (pirin superfamily)
MITHIPAAKRHGADYGWLKTFYLFSFAHYFDPDNLQFGNLRVFNDDAIAPHRGFDTHGHENMEIVTILFKGTLTHTDSMGNKAHIRAGEMQRMSAGRGVMHAEQNEGSEAVELYQIWLTPNQVDLEPSYEQKDFSEKGKKNELCPLVGSSEGALRIHADSEIFWAELEANHVIERTVPDGRGVFIYVREGVLTVNGQKIRSGDQMRIASEPLVIMQAEESCQFILIDVLL